MWRYRAVPIPNRTRGSPPKAVGPFSFVELVFRLESSDFFTYFAPVSRFVLKPARLLLTRFVTSRTGDEQSLDLKGLMERFAPTREPGDRINLMHLRRGEFMGLVRSGKNPNRIVTFLLVNPDQSGNVDFVLKNDPSFENRLVEVYRVEEAVYDARITEEPNPSKQVA